MINSGKPQKIQRTDYKNIFIGLKYCKNIGNDKFTQKCNFPTNTTLKYWFIRPNDDLMSQITS